MGQFLNLESFFQRPHIPIGQRDKEQLGEIYIRNDGSHAFANWLIALMWEEDETDAGWKTIVYPVAKGRAFGSSLRSSIRRSHQPLTKHGDFRKRSKQAPVTIS